MNRLAVYGSLAPGRSNHDVIAGVPGTWTTGRVEGRLIHLGWGADLGYPALIPEPGSDNWIDAWILESDELAHHWARLDEFEGAEYERVTIDVHTADAIVVAEIYRLRPDRQS